MKPRTQAQLDKATDARLQKTYNITLKDYERMLKEQDGKCAITGRPAGTRRLHVDHDHGWKHVQITTEKKEAIPAWWAKATYLGVEYKGYGQKKSLAVKMLKRNLLRASVRGLLSYSANAGLQKFSDNPEWLRSAADYLEKHRETHH